MDYTLDQIKVKAFDQTELPDPDCPLPERALWWQLHDIYARYRAGTISKEQGERQKQKALQTFTRDKSKYGMLTAIANNQARMWSQIEQTATRYANSNNRTPEADAFMEAVYGCKLKDTASL